MRQLTPIIKKILEINEPVNNIAPRDSDWALIVRVLRACNMGLDDRQERMLASINFESIRRTRQKLQEDGHYPPSPEIAKQRKLKSLVMQQTIPKMKPENVESEVKKIYKPLPWGQGY